VTIATSCEQAHPECSRFLQAAPVPQPSQTSQATRHLSWEVITAFVIGAVSASLITALGLQGSLFQLPVLS
jgi:hypothetical protein